MPFHDSAAEHAAVRGAVGVFDRSDLGMLEVTGRDRASFLHALLSNDIAARAPGQGCAATLLDVHGKVQVLLRVLVLEDRVLVLTPPDAAARTLEALDTYLFSEKAYMRDASGEHAIAMLAGPDAVGTAARIAGAAPVDTAWSHVAGAIGGAAVRLVRGSGETGEPEVWILSAAADGPAVWDAVVAAGARPIGREAFETLRIEAGTPAFPDDMGPTVLLPEVPFAELVAQTKGCYIGQEVIVRIRDRGHVNRLLRGLALDGDTVPPVGASIVAGDAEVGRVTSAAWSPALKRPIALGFVRRQHATAGTPVTVRAGGATFAATVSDLPFARA
ncbi:MAG TPA: glycine cleavage T C-terminal barrel domain-containing protein [Terriglobales bacterium]|nr:glycine cleavage T C-terminal barrel domain-containing protein [Terriglobales bacterium]